MSPLFQTVVYDHLLITVRIFLHAQIKKYNILNKREIPFHKLNK